MIADTCYCARRFLTSARRHDNIAELIGIEMPSFQATHGRVLKDVKRELLDYIKDVKKAADEPEAAIPNQVYLKYDELGFPILVGLNPDKVLPKQEIEDLVRAYLSRHYR